VPTPLITYPFRLSAGSVVVAEQGTDLQLASEIAAAVVTSPDERVLVPAFGIADPAFVGFDVEALRLHIALFGPPVAVEDVQIKFLDATTQDVVVLFSSE
jgi:hypothetical protein